jgi:hypothetical protein
MECAQNFLDALCVGCIEGRRGVGAGGILLLSLCTSIGGLLPSAGVQLLFAYSRTLHLSEPYDSHPQRIQRGSPGRIKVNPARRLGQ